MIKESTIILLWADFLESIEYILYMVALHEMVTLNLRVSNQYLVTFWSFKITCALLGVSIENLKSILFSPCSIALFTKFWAEFHTLSMFTTLFRASAGVIPFAIIRKFWRQAFTMSKREIKKNTVSTGWILWIFISYVLNDSSDIYPFSTVYNNSIQFDDHH